MSVTHLFEALGHGAIAGLIEDDITGLFPTFVAPAKWYGYPPALIPVMSDGSLPSYIGLWRNWFGERADSFVEMSVSRDHIVHEIARSDRQLIDLLCARLIVLHDGITDEIRAFAARHEATDLDQIDEATLDTGDAPSGLAGLSSFAGSLPLESTDAATYDGTFPAPGRTLPPTALAFEFDPETFGGVPTDSSWLDLNTDKTAAFRECLSEGDIPGAWRYLNAKGWSFREAAEALSAMAEASTNPNFIEMSALWIAHAKATDGGY